MRSINNSTNCYILSSELATAEGYKPGSHDWWNAIRYHNQFTFPSTKSSQENEAELTKRLKECAEDCLERCGE